MKTVLWLVYGFMWVGGAIAGGVSPSAPWAAPLFLVLAGVLALWENKKSAHWMLIAAALGFVFELIGVHTGYPFGAYRYTGVLAPSIAGVPIAIAFAWLILIDFARGSSSNVLLGALVMTAIDLLIDPLAAGPLGYWQWLVQGWYFGIPAINFAGWFGVSLLILSIIPKQPVRRAYVGWTVIAFFTVLALRRTLYLPAAVGLMLLVLPSFRQFVFWRWLPDRLSGTPSQSSPAS